MVSTAAFPAFRRALTLLSGAAVLVATLGVGPLPAASKQPAAATDTAYPTVSRPSDQRDLAFSIRGKVAEVLVKAGDTVKKGDLLVRMVDAVQVQTVELAKARADDKTPEKAAAQSLSYREAELAMTEESHGKGGANEADLRESRHRRTLAAIDVEAAANKARENAVSLAREQAQLEEMRIVAPIDATVIDVHKKPGETLDEMTSVVTVVAVDPLWLDVNVPTRAAVGLEVGYGAEVTWEDIDGVAPMRGTIIFKSPAGNGGARVIPVRVEVPNPHRIPAGLHGRVRFLGKPASAPPSTPAPDTAAGGTGGSKG
jgi:RND family efflux transporter MFP subunit